MNTENIQFGSNRVADIERLFHKELDTIYGAGETRMMVRMLFEAWMGWPLAELLMRREETINQSDLLRFHWALEDLKRSRPIQQIIGWTLFCGCRIEVDENTLIPRPETEEIVERTIASYLERPPRRVLDICTGSGCIAIALAKAWPETEVWAVDISSEALAKARENAAGNGVEVAFIQADILNEEVTLPYPVDLIVSNPPYICERERKEMSTNVLDYEPGLALFVPDTDPMLFYRRIAQQCRRWIGERGRIVVEINEHYGKETLAEFEKEGAQGRVERDFWGKERMMIAEMDNKKR